jgi:transposase
VAYNAGQSVTNINRDDAEHRSWQCDRALEAAGMSRRRVGPEGRFTFVFTPKHGSWLNLVEGFFSKLARSVLRHIRVASKQQLKDRIMAAIDDINRDPVVHNWTYRLNKAA